MKQKFTESFANRSIKGAFPLTVYVLAVIFSAQLFAQVKVEQPNQLHPTSFAIIIDKITYEKANEAVYAYRDAVEEDGLSVYVVSNEWNTPEEVRTEVLKLYNGNLPLEGVVFVGDIPIPMIRGAQHLTSAFKMNEDKYPWFRSSVPSDRFYDDFDLRFDYLSKDTVNNLCFYYSLREDSPQKVSRDIYSGRIIAPVKDDSKYEFVKNFLYKAAENKKEANAIDNMMVYTGYGYHSESLTSWTDEHISLREQFPQLFKPGGKLNFLNFRMSRKMKEIVMTELEKPELDIAVFHAHGNPDVQYLDDYPPAEQISQNAESIKMFLRSKLRSAKRRKRDLQEVKNYYITHFGVSEKWFEGAFEDSLRVADSLFVYNLELHSKDLELFAPQAELVMFDQCFNGSFHRENYIAGRYLFGTGNTIAAIANSVNCLQDKWANKFLGLLNYGLRIGQLHKNSAYIENHVLGDPTYRFANKSSLDINRLAVLEKDNVSLWKEYLTKDEEPLRGFAVYKLFGLLNEDFEDDLIDIYKSDPSFNVRLHAFSSLAELNSPVFQELLKETINDPYEFIRRKSVKIMGKIGKDEYIPILLKQSIHDPSPRVSFNAKTALSVLNPSKASEAAEKIIDGMADFIPKELLRQNLIRKFNRNDQWLNEELLQKAFDDTLKISKRINSIRTFRNYNFVEAIPELLVLAQDEKQPEKLRLAAIEALGWFNYCDISDKVIAVCENLSSRDSVPESIKEEAVKTKNRLLAGCNVSLTP